MYYVYIVECRTGTLYTGITTDLIRRIREHNGECAGGARYTRAHGPVVLRYSETCATRSEALQREARIKRLQKREKLALIARAL